MAKPIKLYKKNNIYIIINIYISAKEEELKWTLKEEDL